MNIRSADMDRPILPNTSEFNPVPKHKQTRCRHRIYKYIDQVQIVYILHNSLPRSVAVFTCIAVTTFMINSWCHDGGRYVLDSFSFE